MNRRGFLRLTAGGAAAIAVASLIPAGCSRDYPQASSDGARLRSLSQKEYATVRAVAEAMLVGVPVAAGVVAQRVDAELAVAGEPMLSDMKTVLKLMEHGTLLSGRASRFTALSPEKRRGVLDDWATSRLKLRRGAFQAVKSFVVYFAYVDPATRPITGFAGTWPERQFPIPAYPVDYGEIA